MTLIHRRDKVVFVKLGSSLPSHSVVRLKTRLSEIRDKVDQEGPGNIQFNI